MRFLKEPIERKLSAALGALVAIDDLSISLFGGSLNVAGITVTAHGAAEPILTVRRVKADVAMGAMLRKEVVVKSIVIEGPVVTVVRSDDGSLNLPKRDVKPATPSPAPKAEPDDDDTPSSWKFAAEKIQLLDLSVHYREGGYHASAERIVGELVQRSDAIHATVLAASFGRRDESLDMGEVRAHAVFRTTDVTKLAEAPLDATFEVADAVRGSVSSPALETRKFDVDVRANLVLGMLRRLLPPRLLPSFYFDGQADIHLTASGNPRGGVRVKRLSIEALDVRARPANAAGDEGDAAPATP